MRAHLVLAVLILLAPADGSRRRKSSAGGYAGWRSLQRDCEVLCGVWPSLENDNCINFCKAPPCYYKIFGEAPAAHSSATVLLPEGAVGAAAADKRDVVSRRPTGGPLEPGELDRERASAYSACLRELERLLRRHDGWPPTMDESRMHNYDGSARTQ